MIYPAVVMKIIGFVNEDNSISKQPIENSNKVRVLLDNGSKVDIDFLSNDSELKSLKDYLDNKTNQNLKSDKIKSASADIMFSDSDKFTDKINQIESELGNIKNAKKIAIERVATEALKEKVSIGSASVFRSAIACNDNMSSCNSKSIYVSENEKGVKQYSNSGIYAHATLPNQIPIELSFIRKGSGEFIGYLKLTTSSLINANQINYLLDHTIRTLEKYSFVPNFVINNKMSDTMRLLCLTINDIKRNKQNPNIPLAIETLNLIKANLEANRLDYASFIMELPMLLPIEDFKNGVFTVAADKGKSPIQIFRDALVNTNFSQENPDIKKNLKTQILRNYLEPMINGERYDLKLLCVYNIVAPNIFNESESYGFMKNNIDMSKLTFGVESIRKIHDELKLSLEGN